MRMEGYARVSFKWVVSIAIAVSLRQQTDENIPSSECSQPCSRKLQQKEKLFEKMVYNFQSYTRL